MVVKILDNCCSPDYLDCLKSVALDSENWSMKYPVGSPIDDRYPKLDIIRDGIKHRILAGLAMGLLIQIHETGGRGLFIPEICLCGISIKDKHTPNNIHIDE